MKKGYTLDLRTKKKVYGRCGVCGGSGQIYDNVNDNQSTVTVGTCQNCNGSGEVDTGMWVYI